MSVYAVAYPELVSRGVSKSRKFKWLVKVGACKDVNPLILKKHGWGGFRATRKPPWIRHCIWFAFGSDNTFSYVDGYVKIIW